MKIDPSYIKKTAIFYLILFMGVFLLLPAYVYAVERAFTEEEIKLLKEVKTIRLLVTASSWEDSPYDIGNDIRIKLEKKGFKIVLEETSGYDTTIFVDYKETKGREYGYTPFSGGLGFGTNVNCQIRVVHKTIGNVFETTINGGTPSPVTGGLHYAAIEDLKEKTDFKLFGELIVLFLGQSISPLKDNNWEIRRYYIERLGDSRDKRFVKPLIDTLKDKDWNIRRSAAEALGKIGDMRAVDPLIGTINDEDWMVRRSAAEALGKIGDMRAVDPLNNLYKNETNKFTREAVQRVLEKMKKR